MTESPIGKLAEALAKAQAEFEPIKKDLEANAGTYKYKYADLAAVIEATKAALGKHGLAVTQCAEFVNDKFVMHTRLIHKDGAEVSSFWPMLVGKPQEMGSAASYARRYSLSAILNVASEMDDDAQTAQTAKTEAKTKEIDRAKASAPDAPKANGLWLNDGGAGSTHGSVSAYLDALEGLLSKADDPAQMFDLNESLLGQQQAKAFKVANDEKATEAGRKMAQGIVARITAIHDNIHKGTIPGKQAAE